MLPEILFFSPKSGLKIEGVMGGGGGKLKSHGIGQPVEFDHVIGIAVGNGHAKLMWPESSEEGCQCARTYAKTP